MADDESNTNRPNIQDCSPLELSEYLLKNRFKNEWRETASFLMTALRSLPNSEQIISEIASREVTSSSSSQNEWRETASFLMTALRSLPNSEQIISEIASREVISDEAKTQKPTSGANHELPDLGPSLLYPPDDEVGDNAADATKDQPVEVSLVAPRSKYNLHIQERGLVFKHPKKDGENFVVSSDGVVDKIVIFPKPESCRRTSTSKNSPAGDMVLMSFVNDVAIGKKKYGQVCFQLPTSFTVQRDDDDDDDQGQGEKPPQGTDLWVELLCESLRIDRATEPDKVVRVPNPTEARLKKSSNAVNRFAFSSAQEAGTSTTTGGMPFVKCYHGIQDGVLYPLKEGLLFFKPPLFIPRDRLVSIVSGRGVSASTTGTSSRYFDIIVKVEDKSDPKNQYTEEFTGIARDELQVLQQYIQRVLIPAMKRDAGTTDNTEEANDNDDNNEADDDEEEPPTRDTPGKRTPRRQASVEAQRISRSQMATGNDEEDDEDDEEDYNGRKGGDSADEDSDDDDEDDDNDEDFDGDMVNRGNNDGKRGDDDDDDGDEDDDDDDDWAGGKSSNKKRRRG